VAGVGVPSMDLRTVCGAWSSCSVDTHLLHQSAEVQQTVEHQPVYRQLLLHQGVGSNKEQLEDTLLRVEEQILAAVLQECAAVDRLYY
jgi:hypothetical protein